MVDNKMGRRYDPRHWYSQLKVIRVEGLRVMYITPLFVMTDTSVMSVITNA